MRIRHLLCVIVGLSMATGWIWAADQRGSSTPEERAKALQIIRHLETDPLASAKEERQWLTLWLIEVPDIHVKLCVAFFPSLLDEKTKHGGDLVIQSGYSMAAFQIEHPEQSKDENAWYVAGVEGTLRAYEAILQKEPKSRLPVLDALIVKRDAGALVTLVHETATKCKSK